MTSVYGVTYSGARDQIKKRLKERGAFADDSQNFHAACYAARVRKLSFACTVCFVWLCIIRLWMIFFWILEPSAHSSVGSVSRSLWKHWKRCLKLLEPSWVGLVNVQRSVFLYPWRYCSLDKLVTTMRAVFLWWTDNSFTKQSSLLDDSSWSSSCTTLSEGWKALGNCSF